MCLARGLKRITARKTCWFTALDVTLSINLSPNLKISSCNSFLLVLSISLKLSQKFATKWALTELTVVASTPLPDVPSVDVTRQGNGLSAVPSDSSFLGRPSGPLGPEVGLQHKQTPGVFYPRNILNKCRRRVRGLVFRRIRIPLKYA